MPPPPRPPNFPGLLCLFFYYHAQSGGGNLDKRKTSEICEYVYANTFNLIVALAEGRACMRRDPMMTRETTTHPCCAAPSGAVEAVVARNGITERDIEFHYSLCQTVCGHCVVPLNHVGSTLLPIITHSHVHRTLRLHLESPNQWSSSSSRRSPTDTVPLDIGYKIWKIWNVFIRILSQRSGGGERVHGAN